MNKTETIESVLATEGVFVSTTSGYSMYPMLRDRKDTVILKAPETGLKKGDVVLYKSNGTYILHRILEVREDSFVIRGDNCDDKEYGITKEQILGVLTEFYRGNKQIHLNNWNYRWYCNFLFVWRICRKVKRTAGKIWRALTRRKSK